MQLRHRATSNFDIKPAVCQSQTGYSCQLPKGRAIKRFGFAFIISSNKTLLELIA